MIPVAINMKRGGKRQEAQKMPNNDEEAETLEKKPGLSRSPAGHGCL